ncbi:MAG TPA: glycosyltransferase family 4 protein [Syntrophothermus lipocalidus]|nr:glycosyltransferase family 4 protein [Syntrophothermus lipocalidus]
MTILLVYLGRRGGGATYSLEVAKALYKRCEVVAVISQQAQNLKDWRDIGIKLVEIATYENAIGFISSTFDVSRHLWLRRQIEAFSPDVLYYPMIHLWTPIINKLLPRLPKVVTVHDPILHRGERNLLVQAVQRISMRQATRLILLSRTFVEVLKKQGIPEAKIDVIPHGEFSYYTRGRRAMPSGLNDERTLLFFGRISPYKGLQVLLEAFPIIQRQIPQTRLLIVGSGNIGPYQDQLSRFKNVTVVNRWVSDNEVGDFFSQASIVVAPYVDGTQSGVIPIAYSFGIPVVATNVGGLPEQVVDGVTGFLVPPGDAEALARACVHLLSDPGRRIEMGQAGYRKAMTEWNWDLVAEKVYQSCSSALTEFAHATK